MKSHKRLGLLHPDGSLTLYLHDIGIKQASREANDCDEKQEDPALFTTVVSLRVEDVEAVEVPSLKPKNRAIWQPCRNRILCPPDRDVTIVGVGRRAGAEPRRSAALARRPMHQPTKPLPLFDRARFSTLGS